MKKVIVYTDGACSGNPGPGGYAAILMCGEVKKEISGGEADTTNNRMELRGPIEALKLLKKNVMLRFILTVHTLWMPFLRGGYNRGRTMAGSAKMVL